GEEKARLLVGLAGELTRTLKSVNGIVDARVQVVLPENSPLLDKSEWNPTTASVLVKYQGAKPPLKEDDIKRLVAKGVEGLKAEDVAVVFNKVESTPQPNYAWWDLDMRNDRLAAAGLLLAIISGLGCLVLMSRVRAQTARVEELEKELAKAKSATPEGQAAPRLVAGVAGKS
ncbi:MAG TPA: hypothetical protein VL359_12405, partial [bacterium]|nr:hypothetical protein [bacterium]